MRLHLTNYNLEAASLCLTEVSPSCSFEKTKEFLDEAKKLLDETGYHRKDAEVEGKKIKH